MGFYYDGVKAGYVYYRTDPFQTAADLHTTLSDAWCSYMSKTYPDHFGDNPYAGAAMAGSYSRGLLRPADYTARSAGRSALVVTLAGKVLWTTYKEGERCLESLDYYCSCTTRWADFEFAIAKVTF